MRRAWISQIVGLAVWAGLAGCPSEAPVDPATADRKAYSASAALLKADPAAAAGKCSEIGDAVLAGECATFAAKAMARRKLDALAVCATIQQQGWRQVCYFESVDAGGFHGEKAIRACQHTAGFRQRCLSHALARETDLEWRIVEAGREQAFLDWIGERMTRYGLDDKVENIPRDFLARRIALRLAEEERTQKGRRFARADCGPASDDTCREVYRFYVRKLFRQQNMAMICSQPLTREAVERAGLPAWEDDFAEDAPEMWRRLCRELTGGGKPPRANH